MDDDNGGGAFLGVIVGAMLVVLVAVFAFGGGFQWIRGEAPGTNVTIQTPMTPTPPTAPQG